MDVAEFDGWLSGIAALTPPQRRQAWQTLAWSEASACDDTDTGPPWGVEIAGSGAAAAPDQPPASTPSPVAQPLDRLAIDVVAELGQRRVDSIGCPPCDSRDVVHWGKASALPRYRCKGCQRTFNALTKTPLSGLRMKHKWPAQAAAMIDGVSIAKAAQRCDVDYTTAFRWRHRFLASLAGDKPETLSGIVEGDETFILESFKRQAVRDAASGAQERWQIGQARDFRRPSSGPRGTRLSGCDHGCGAAETEPHVDYSGAWRSRHVSQRILLRRWHRDRCLHPQGWNPNPHLASAWQT
jgi:transposase-like protein